MKRNKSGISLIVLVITIIVMIILATVTIISLNSTNIIEKADEAIESTNLKQVQSIANMAWAEWYLGGVKTQAKLEEIVNKAMSDNKIVTDKYNIDISINGVTVTLKDKGYITNKANGRQIASEDGDTYKVVSYGYEIMQGKEITSMTVNSSELGITNGTLNAEGNWQISLTGGGKIGFGVNSDAGTKANTLYVMDSSSTELTTGTIKLQFTFADGKVETDTIKYDFTTYTQEHILNKANGKYIEAISVSQYYLVEHEYELASGVEIASISVTDTSDNFSGVLNAANSWAVR